MDLLEVRRLSALFVGWRVEPTGDGRYRVYDGDYPIPIYGIGNWIMNKWSPDTNAEQMAECMDKLLEDSVVIFGFDGSHELRWHKSATEIGSIFIKCPWRRFPMYAAAELQRRKG